MAQTDHNLLAYEELNTEATSSLVCIHGAFANSTTWKKASPHLTSYHLILPDLPEHGRSRKAFPTFTLEDAADQVAILIRSKCKNGRARLVGLSLGAWVALEILTRHPDVVDDDAILSGFNRFPELNGRLTGTLGWFFTQVGNLVPASKEKEEMMKDADGNLHPAKPYSYWMTIFPKLCTNITCKPWAARTMIIAAGVKVAGLITDRASNARELRDIGIKGNPSTQAYWNEKLVHPWPMVEGELFAKTALAWFNHSPLPDGFEVL